jgi:hypothetical protein
VASSAAYGLAVLCKPVEAMPTLQCCLVGSPTTDTRFHSSLIKDPREDFQRFFDLQYTVFVLSADGLGFEDYKS